MNQPLQAGQNRKNKIVQEGLRQMRTGAATVSHFASACLDDLPRNHLVRRENVMFFRTFHNIPRLDDRIMKERILTKPLRCPTEHSGDMLRWIVILSLNRHVGVLKSL
jgi:hypothetical protein